MDLNQWIAQRLAGKDVPLNLRPDQQDLNGLSLETAINAHKAWCDKLELTLRGKNPEEYDPAILGVDHLCLLGKWLYGDGKVLDKHEEYHKVLQTHADFHKCAGGILENHKKGYFAEAISALRHDLVALSNDVQLALVQLLAKVRENQ